MKALDQLIKHGFIDIIKQGNGGVKGDKSLYSISDRWKKFGTPEFIQVERRKDKRGGRGYAAYWAKKNLNIGIENDTPLREKDVNGVSKTILNKNRQNG